MKRQAPSGPTAEPTTVLLKPDLKLKPGQTFREGMASVLVGGVAANAVAALEWSAFPFGSVETIDANALLTSVADAGKRVNCGDLTDAEALLAAQTVTLNALFVSLAHRANASQYVENFDRYLRLALKAQSQCRATCEALALLKNPPVFTRQANIATQQVVNNGTMVGGSRAGDRPSAPNGVLEAHGERVDDGATTPAVNSNPALATMGTLDRPAHGGGQGALLPERLPRGREAVSARGGAIPGGARRAARSESKARESVDRDPNERGRR